MKAVNHQHVKYSSTLIAVKLLNAIKGFFTFKELENILNISTQMLWRYTRFQTLPERDTASKIIDRIKKAKLIDKIVDKVLQVNEEGIIEIWRIISNLHFLNILGYIALEFTGNENIDVVFAFSDNAKPIATIIADWLRCKLCITETVPSGTKGYLVEIYASAPLSRVNTIFVPHELLPSGTKVLIVHDIARSGKGLKAAIRLVRKARATPWGVMTIISLSNEWVNTLKTLGVYRILTVKEFSLNKNLM